MGKQKGAREITWGGEGLSWVAKVEEGIIESPFSK
jgi:hypothetical protein